MKRKITMKATGDSSVAKVTVELTTGQGYMRHETTRLVLDIADDVMAAVGKHYRASKIRLI